MTTDTAQLIERQQLCFNNIRHISVNYGKDSASRKTPEYLALRLEALEAHWSEFEANNDRLKQVPELDHEYFTQDIFNKAKDLYEKTRHLILTAQLSQPRTPNKDPEQQANTNMDTNEQKPGPSSAKFDFGTTKEEETGKNPAQEQLVKQQLLNFKAFERTASKVILENIEDKWELEDSLKMLNSRWNAIDKIHWEIEYLLNADATYLCEYNKRERQYERLKRDINKKIWEDHNCEKSTPKIDIPEFKGDYKQWASFRDIYVETIHTSKWLTKPQKMQHLKSKLKGEPERLIQHLHISADNYDTCWDLLINRYENKRLLFSSFMNTLLSLPTIQTPSAYSIKKMHDTLLECVNGLNNLGLQAYTWDPILVHLMLPKLDSVTYGEYIHDLDDPRQLPKLADFLAFLEMKFIAFETLKQNQGNQKQENAPKKQSFWQQKGSKNNSNERNDERSTNSKKPGKWTNSHYTTRQNCPLCKKDHTLMKCDTFNNMNVETRNDNVTKLQLCRNCLFNHPGKECGSQKTCKICAKEHHTLLHMDNKPNESSKGIPSTSQQRGANHVTSDDTEVLLTTVQLMVKNGEGNYVTLRALLDQGSQVSLITENAAQRLRLKRSKMSAVISGVGKSLGNSKGLLTLESKSIHTDYTFTAEVLIMNKLINNLPSTNLTTTNWDHLRNLKLADPDFHVPGPIDILLGADVYSMIIEDGVLKQEANSPVAQNTKLGWILCGNVRKSFNCLVTLNELEDLSKFWEIEEVHGETDTTQDEFCENHYVQNTKRLNTGQYVVQMPMKTDWEENLGKSRPQAVSQFLQLERKMERQEHFAKQYKMFITEYAELGHMRPAQRSTNSKAQAYLPHHGVIREESTTTKLRVVFNASQKTDTKYSLNDLMEKGPNLQKDILSLILKWRSYRYALTADIEKMFRAIFLHEEQRSLQKIIWRSSPYDMLKEMELCTVTYGTKAAPFLAMRTLLQLAKDEGQAYPMADKVLRHHFYMDDVIAGHDTIEGARTMQKELYALLKKGGFTLRKWASNEPAVLQDLPDTQKSQQNVFSFKQDTPMKTLGLGWNTSRDYFCFDWEVPVQISAKYTKRMLLSDISKLYDPLGWLAPIIISTKLLFQNLWNSSLGWDENIPEKTANEWERIRCDLVNIKNMSIPRWINGVNNRIELHGFCDASDKAYAGVVYTKTVNERGDYVTTLLASKTKVAPLKKKPSLPRLELCGALLLSQLLEKIKTALAESELDIHCWSDSKVVLAWIQGGDKKWEKYIANRTAIITSVIPAGNWNYVNTKENPADCATRGLLPSQLLDFGLWWKGPQWLIAANEVDENRPEKYSTNEGSNYECCVTQQTNDDVMNQLIARCSTLTRATRSFAWVLRFITMLRDKKRIIDKNELTLDEINQATECLLKFTQKKYFSEEISDLQRNGSVSPKSKILNLSPFLDDKGVLRVGGRLRHSALSEEAKHPALLPHSGRFTELVIDSAHRQTLHGGVRLSLAQTRQRYWILGGNRAVKGLLRHCIRCHRFKVTKNEQIMGNLPQERVTPSRPFTHCGVDFTGHVEVKLNKGRGVRTCKGYIAIFICMATKAVHVELVSDLSTPTFLAALKRLCARRGTPKCMYSDNGTNFKGAAKLLYEEFQEYQTMTSPEFFKAINEQQIEWHFLAPHWPSAAGVWEAAVKSMKYHLMRVLGHQKLDFEQFTTLLAEIEGCMNSRPLCPLTEDVDDLDCLTPGHFLTGTPIMSLPQENCTEQRVDLRNKWKLVEAMHQHVWRRWSTEYLHQLQTKSKWLKPKENISVGDLVLVKEDNLPPGKWAMARVLDLHPGADGLVRVVTLKTSTNVLKRPIVKLSPLPKRETANVHVDGGTGGSENKPPIDSNKRRRQNKPKCKMSNYATILMLCLCALISSAHALPRTPPARDIITTPIQDNRPMYFDEIGNLQFIHDEWTLLVYLNLTTYWSGTSRIEKYIKHLDFLCSRGNKLPCEPVIMQLKHEFRQLTDYNEILLSQHLRRKKRGYINGIGSLARTLFGVLDEDFANKYETDIGKIQLNENHLLELLKNQTSIVETENNIVKTNEKFMNSQFETIHDYLTVMNQSMAKIAHRVEAMAAMNELNAATLTASMILSNLKRTQDLLLDAVADIHKGYLDMHLLTPKQLMYELRMIAARISTRLTLPVKHAEENIQDVYKLLFVKARVTTSYLLFEVHIPLTSDEEYQLYRVIPLPMHLENGDITIVQPTSTHIAVNFRKNTYISVQQDELSQCEHMKNDNFICTTNHPIYNSHSSTAPCEAKILSQQLNLNCITAKTKCADGWIKLHADNSWLYSCCGDCQARIICEDSITSMNLANIGIMKLEESCVLQKQDTSLFAYNHFGSRMHLDAAVPSVPDMNVNDNIPLNLSSTIQLPSTIDQNERHSQLDAQLKQQRDNEHLPIAEISSHDIHQYALLYLLVGGASAAAVYALVKHRRCCKRITANQAAQAPTTYDSQPARCTHPQPESLEMRGLNQSRPPQKPRRLFSFDTNDMTNGTN